MFVVKRADAYERCREVAGRVLRQYFPGFALVVRGVHPPRRNTLRIET